jgi:hypothetical protein
MSAAVPLACTIRCALFIVLKTRHVSGEVASDALVDARLGEPVALSGNGQSSGS